MAIAIKVSLLGWVVCLLPYGLLIELQDFTQGDTVTVGWWAMGSLVHGPRGFYGWFTLW